MATSLFKLHSSSNIIRQKFPSSAVVSCFPQVYSTSKDVTEIKPLPSSSLSSLKRGTGGRSSFNGVVATVFGGTGFIATYVINRLGKIGTQIIVPYRSDSHVVRRLKLAGDLGQVLFMPFYLKDEKALYKAMKHSNVVINLIGNDIGSSNFSLEDVHVTAARNIARIARECGVKRLIHVSSLNVAEKPDGVLLKGGSRFLSAKWQGEQAVRDEFPEAIIFRPSDVYGQRDRFLNYYAGLWRHQRHKMPLWNKGVGVIKQPVYVGDLAGAIVKAITDSDAPGKIFQAVGPKRYELSELVDWFHRVMRKDEDWGYKRYDMKYDLLFWLRVSLTEKIMKVRPTLSWDRIEREHVTDVVFPDMPTLEDLGVSLTAMEDRIKWELRIYKAMAYYDDELGEFEEPTPPPVYSG